jgi:hypothetical protein
MRFTKMVVMKGGLQKVKDGFWRSRRVLTPDEAALLGKKALTKPTGTTDYDEAKRICEGHLAEFERIIADARGDHLSPLDKLLRDNPHMRFAPLDEISDAGMEVGVHDLFVAPPNTPMSDPVTFATLLGTWEL